MGQAYQLSDGSSGFPLVDSDSADVFQAVLNPGTELAVWHRIPDPKMTAWIDGLAADRFPNGRVCVPVSDARMAVKDLVEASGTPGGAGAAAFIDDVADLAARFSRISGVKETDIRIEHVLNDACWKFHRDCVSFRLVCTYYGPGTEYVPLNRAEEALEKQRDYDGPIHVMPRYAAALFKGSDASQTGIVHRSAPIADKGLSRFVVVLNAPMDQSL